MTGLEKIIGFVAGLIWGPHTTLLLLGTGLYLSLRLRFVQLRRFGLSFRLLTGIRRRDEADREEIGDISPFQALATSLAAVIGNGNIAGVCTAIAMGGPGAVFWMWVLALLGMATKIVEAVLGQIYRRTVPDGTVRGGPMFYISHGLKLPWLAGIFAFFMGSKALFATTLIQSNSIALALNTALGVDFWISGLALAAVVWLVIIGGIRSIARVTVWLSPAMVVIYIVGALATIAAFAGQIPHAFDLIFTGAFHPASVGGGVTGITVARAIRYGLARGAYSNEAGTGTAAVFHAAARTPVPARQGLVASLDVFVDTIIICTLTALAVLVTGVWTSGTSTEMTANAFNAALPGLGGLIVAAASALFGFSSLIANPYYGEISFGFLLGEGIRTPFRWIYCGMIFLGAVLGVETTWGIGDIFNGGMAFTNCIGLVGLAGTAVAAVRAFEAGQRAESPVLPHP